MRIDIATIFPELCENFLQGSITGRAQTAKLVSVHCHNIRDYSDNHHRKTDDEPYGGGHGMVMTPEPIARTCEHVASCIGEKPHTIFLTAQGKRYDQQEANRLAKYDNILLVCGHYEGIDRRVIDMFADEEISIGDFVLTGGEAAAICVADSLIRLQSGVLSSDEGYEKESHYEKGYLEHPHYTRPAVWRGLEVPEVLRGGNHKLIEEWKQENSATTD